MAKKKEITESGETGVVFKLDLGSIAKKAKLEQYRSDADEEDEFISTNVMVLDLAISGKVEGGGIPLGKITEICAPTKTGKSFVGVSVMKSAQKAGMSILVIDTERAFSKTMAEGFGIDISPDRFFHYKRGNDINDIRNFIVQFVQDIPWEHRKNLLIIFDSWGSLVSSRLIDNALEGKDTKDMSAPVEKNELANVLLGTGCTCYVVMPVYQATGTAFGDPTKIGGGSKIMLNAQAAILGYSKSQDKEKDGDTKVLTGYIVTSKIFKSRYAKEDTRFEYRIKTNGGLDRFYGLLPFALKGGYVKDAKIGNAKAYVRECVENDEPKVESEIYNADWWRPLFKDGGLKDYLEMVFAYDNTFDTEDSI